MENLPGRSLFAGLSVRIRQQGVGSINVLVLDVGTSSMRGILFDEAGRILLQAQKKYRPEYKSPAWIEQPASDFKDALLEISTSVAEGARNLRKNIEVISITAQRSAVIPLGGDGTPLMPAVMWQDTRNAELCRELEKWNNEVFRRSGTTVNTVFSGGKMSWIKRGCPEIAAKIWKFVNIPEYLMYSMTGRLVSDHTYGSRSNLMNLRKRDWDPELLKLFGIRRNELCELQEPGTEAGRITAEFAGLTGIREGTPVITAGGDQQCAAVGQGAVSEGILSIVSGTGAYLVLPCREIPEGLPRQMICNCSAIAGQYILEASVLTCASAFDWFLRNFYGEEKDFGRINGELQELYEKEEDVLTLPYFQGRSSGGWNAEAKAVFANITLSTTRQDILKSLVEGIFMEVGNSIRQFRNYVDISEGYISGGMTKSAVMNQMQADIYGIPLKRMESVEATARGALLVTLAALGVYPSPEKAFYALQREEPLTTYTPDQGKTEGYRRKQTEMNRMYQKIYR